MKLQLL